MIVTDAFWEKRNLGCNVTEIACEAEDSTEQLKSEIERINVPYSVIKVPSGRTDLLFEAQKNGYLLIETTTAIEGVMKKVALPKIYERFLPDIRMEDATPELKEKALSEVRKGEIFETDRIAMDPYFSKEKAGERYYNWSLDAFEKGAVMGVAFYRDEPVAFNVSLAKDDAGKVYDGLIGGLFTNAFHRGLGFLVVYTETELCRRRGGKRCLGRVSSNNVPILRLHAEYGFDIKDVNYVLIKHK